jgi:hypothetical protein
MPGSAGCAGARQLTRGVNKRNARKPAQNDGNPRRSPQLLASRIDPENAETEGIPPVFACSLPGSRQHNSASSNNRMSGSPNIRRYELVLRSNLGVFTVYIYIYIYI